MFEAQRKIALAGLLIVCALPAQAVNRCVLPSGKVTYTDASCESIGAQLQREVRPPSAPASQGRGGAGADRIDICYVAKDARPEVTHEQVEEALRSAAAMWNGGCSDLRFEYAGRCSGVAGVYRVFWMSYDGQANKDHAVASASRSHGVSISLSVDSAGFLRSWRRALVHELGHLAGIGHSTDPNDLMYQGGRRSTPTLNDFAACNRAAAKR